VERELERREKKVVDRLKGRGRREGVLKIAMLILKKGKKHPMEEKWQKTCWTPIRRAVWEEKLREEDDLGCRPRCRDELRTRGTYGKKKETGDLRRKRPTSIQEGESQESSSSIRLRD